MSKLQVKHINFKLKYGSQNLEMFKEYNYPQSGEKLIFTRVSFYISEITLLELEYGVENCDSTHQDKQKLSLENFSRAFNDRILPIRNCFSIYAKQRTRLRKLGTPISDFDLLIGSTSLAYNFIMVTDNIKEFTRLENITIENWVER